MIGAEFWKCIPFHTLVSLSALLASDLVHLLEQLIGIFASYLWLHMSVCTKGMRERCQDFGP